MDTLSRLLLLTTLGCVEIKPVAPALVSAGPRGHEVLQFAAGEGAPLVFAAVPLHAPVPVVRVLSAAAPLRPRRHPPSAPAQYTAAAGDADYEEEPRVPRVPRPNKQRTRPTYQQDADYEETYQYPRQTPPSQATHRPSRVRPQITQYEEEYETYAPQPSFTAPSTYVQPQQAYSYSTSYAAPHQTHPTSYGAPQMYSTLAQPQYEAVYATGTEPASALLYARPSPTGGYTYRKIAPKTTTQIPVKPTKESPYIIKIHKYRITKS